MNSRHHQPVDSVVSAQAAPLVLETVTKLLEHWTGKAVDLGAGRGALSRNMKKMGYDVTAVDLYPEHFHCSDIQCLRGDVQKHLPFMDAAFDVAVAVEVIEHTESHLACLREISRIVKPGGHILVTSPNVENLASRIAFMAKARLPFFRDSSFEGCYHISPLFSWQVRWYCRVLPLELQTIHYNRSAWPRDHDVPRGAKGSRIVRFLDLFPLSSLLGEIAIYELRRTSSAIANTAWHPF